MVKAFDPGLVLELLETYQVNDTAIEALLFERPTVGEVAVVGLPDGK